MQTFLPYPNFIDSLQCLDNKRLGKQRVEAMQILNILTGKSKSNAWKNHPAVLMWQGYTKALALYMNVAIEIWENRGFKNTMKYSNLPLTPIVFFPDWIGDKKFYSSHRSNLLRKNSEHYKQFNWKEKNNLPYYWPVTTQTLNK